MPKQTLDNIYDQLKAEAKKDVLASLQPKIEKLKALGDEILTSLGQAGKKRGPKPKKAAAKKVGRKKKAAKKQSRTPSGALAAAISDVLAGQTEAINLVGIRDAVLKQSMFKRRDAKNLYTQIVQKIKSMKDVEKIGKTYILRKPESSPNL